MGFPIVIAKPNCKIKDYIYGVGSNCDNIGYFVDPPCGTAGCFGGWTVLIGSPGRMRDKIKLWNDVEWKSVSTTAAELLGLEMTAVEKIFHVESWPINFQNAFAKAKTTEKRAKIAAARFRQFREWALEEGL
jgi:hypothetical protein